MSKAEILLVLLNWAAHLSGYDMQPVPPVKLVTHEWLVEHACYRKECHVVGWYNDTGVVFIDEAYSNLEDGFTSSLLVHEFVHYLQHKSGYWHRTPMDCNKRVSREREAYAIQNRYIERVLATPMQVMPAPVFCQ